MRRVLVTGCSGLIGRWVCNLLAEQGMVVQGVDHRAAPVPRENWSCELVDILDPKRLSDVFEEFAPDAVLHLAARCDLNGTSLEDYDTNISGVRNVCRAVEQTPSVQRAIYTSSQLVCKVGHIPTSDTEYCPNTIYGESKVRTEEIVRAENGGGVTWCLVRPTTVWGPHMSPHYTSLLRHIMKGTYFHSGEGALLKSYSYVENIAYQYSKLLVAPAEKIGGKVFYLADYLPLSLRSYVDMLADSFGVKRPITVPLNLARLFGLLGDGLNRLGIGFPFNSFRLRNIRTEYVFDLSATEDVCGPLPKSFEDGVRETSQWFLDTCKSNVSNRA